MRVAAPVLGPVWLIALRVFIAGMVLLPLVIQRRQFHLLKANFGRLVAAGVMSAALPFTLLAYAALDLSAGLTSILNATVPIFAALIGYALFEEQLGLARVSGVVMGFAGVVILIGLPTDAGTPPLLAVLAGLTAAVSYVFAANFAKRRLQHLPGIVFVTGSQLGGVAMLAPLLPFFPIQHAPQPSIVAAVIALAVLSTSLAFLIYFRLIREVGPMRTLSVTYLIPLFAIVWGAIFLDETVTLSMAIGGGLILSGVALANRRAPIRDVKSSGQP